MQVKTLRLVVYLSSVSWLIIRASTPPECEVCVKITLLPHTVAFNSIRWNVNQTNPLNEVNASITF